MIYRVLATALSLVFLSTQAQAQLVAASGTFDGDSQGILSDAGLQLGDAISLLATIDEVTSTFPGTYVVGPSLDLWLGENHFQFGGAEVIVGLGAPFSLVILRTGVNNVLLNGNTYTAAISLADTNGTLQTEDFPATVDLADFEVTGLVLIDSGQIARADIDVFGWPQAGADVTQQLMDLVFETNLQAGISNSLDAKLSNVLSILDDSNDSDDVAALNGTYAFCNSVTAQRGKKLTAAQADQLVSVANFGIRSLDENAPFCN